MIVRCGSPCEDGDLAAWVARNLREALQLLAADADEQIAHFLPPDFAFKADEMALDLDDSARVFRSYWTMTQDQAAKVEALDGFLEVLSGADYTDFWSDASIRDDPRWVEARQLAQATLDAFGWTADVPPRETYCREA